LADLATFHQGRQKKYHPVSKVMIADSDIITYHLDANRDDMTAKFAELKKRNFLKEKC
jgi:hypothetical protein